VVLRQILLLTAVSSFVVQSAFTYPPDLDPPLSLGVGHVMRCSLNRLDAVLQLPPEQYGFATTDLSLLVERARWAIAPLQVYEWIEQGYAQRIEEMEKAVASAESKLSKPYDSASGAQYIIDSMAISRMKTELANKRAEMLEFVVAKGRQQFRELVSGMQSREDAARVILLKYKSARELENDSILEPLQVFTDRLELAYMNESAFRVQMTRRVKVTKIQEIPVQLPSVQQKNSVQTVPIKIVKVVFIEGPMKGQSAFMELAGLDNDLPRPNEKGYVTQSCFGCFTLNEHRSYLTATETGDRVTAAKQSKSGRALKLDIGTQVSLISVAQTDRTSLGAKVRDEIQVRVLTGGLKGKVLWIKHTYLGTLPPSRPKK
jgi:hypothetical protein